MSVDIFRRLLVVTELENAERVILSLIGACCVEFEQTIVPSSQKGEPVLLDYLKGVCDVTYQSGLNISKIGSAIDILSKYSANLTQTPKRAVLTKVKRRRDLFSSDIQICRLCDTVEETLKLSKALEDLTEETSRLESDIERLLPWESYSEPLSFKGTESTSFFFGSIPVSFDIEEIIQRINDLCACIQPISWDESVYYVRLITHNECRDEVLALLSEYEFKINDYEDIDQRARVALSAARKRLITIEGERIRKEERLAYLSESLDTVKQLYDHTVTLGKFLEISRGVPISETSACISAILPAFCTDKADEILNEIGCAYEYSMPDTSSASCESYVISKNSEFARKHESELLKYIKTHTKLSLKDLYSQSGKEFVPVTPSEIYTEE